MYMKQHEIEKEWALLSAAARINSYDSQCCCDNLPPIMGMPSEVRGGRVGMMGLAGGRREK